MGKDKKPRGGPKGPYRKNVHGISKHTCEEKHVSTTHYPDGRIVDRYACKICGVDMGERER